MLATHWLLAIGILLNDGQSTSYEETTYKKEYCMQQARVTWSHWYATNMDTQGSMTTLCRNSRDHYDFFKVTCDRYGNCTQ